jgi:hypothetical protein
MPLIKHSFSNATEKTRYTLGTFPVPLAPTFLAGMEHGETVGLERGCRNFVSAGVGRLMRKASWCRKIGVQVDLRATDNARRRRVFWMPIGY